MADLAEIVADLRAEGDQLYKFLLTLDDEDWSKETKFKSWTPNDVVGHLHFFDYVGVESHKGEEAFAAVAAKLGEPGYIEKYLDGATGKELAERWIKTLHEMCDRFSTSESSRRLKWFGPDMGISMFTTARLMETWSHSWAIYDMKGESREQFDRIKSIATIGVKTYGWTFVNRKVDVPEPKPYIEITAPSGEIWTWNEPQADNKITGDAVEFCQVVSQVRNIADVNLTVEGGPATQWMEVAQCFAGPPNDPPAPGTRGLS